jgi:hypothetical protein
MSDIVPSQSEATKAKYMSLLREMIVNGRKLTDDQIEGRAAFSLQQGLDPISEVNTIIDKEGRTLSHTMHINGYRRKCLEQERNDCPGGNIDLEFIPMEKEEMPAGAYVGFECRLRDDASYVGWQKRVTQLGKVLRDAIGGSVTFSEIMQASGPAPVYTGIGIVYQDELNPYKDRNFNPHERAKKRAENNARKRRFPTNAPMIENENGVGGIVVEDVAWGEDEDATGKKVSDVSQPVITVSPREIPMLAEKPLTATLTLSEAMEVVNSKGVPYYQLESKDLSYMSAAIIKSLGKPDIKEPDRIANARKLNAIKLILEARAKDAPPVEPPTVDQMNDQLFGES